MSIQPIFPIDYDAINTNSNMTQNVFEPYRIVLSQIGNTFFNCKFQISSENQCCEIFGLYIYIDEKNYNHCNREEIQYINEFFNQIKNEECIILKSNFICKDGKLDKRSYKFEIVFEVVSTKKTFSFLFVNYHNGYYKHNFEIWLNGKLHIKKLL
jgi:hypothetical protein